VRSSVVSVTWYFLCGACFDSGYPPDRLSTTGQEDKPGRIIHQIIAAEVLDMTKYPRATFRGSI
jgi:hypothetical protein